MREQRITIEISHDGKITADAEGFSGDACLRDLERLLEGLAPGKACVKPKSDDGNERRASTRTQDLRKRE